MSNRPEERKEDLSKLTQVELGQRYRFAVWYLGNKLALDVLIGMRKLGRVENE